MGFYEHQDRAEAAKRPFKLLVVDDEPLMRSALFRTLKQRDHEITLANDGIDAVAILERSPPDTFGAAIIDLNMPRMNGHELLGEIKRRCPATQVIILTGTGTIDDAVRAMRAGADDFLLKPYDPYSLRERVRAAEHVWSVKRMSAVEPNRDRRADAFDRFLGNSPEMRRVQALARRMGDSEATLLIQGESGTGKEEFARAVHRCGKRKSAPFVTVDLASISPDVIGSELFGHARGAFTGAVEARTGLIRSAGKGTIFFDEIGELPLGLQTTLLRVIQEHKVRPVGSEEIFPVEARVITATNRDLVEAVHEGRFRKDLYHRLNVVEVTLPPLRERKEDIPELAAHFLDKYIDERPTIQGFTSEALALLALHDWPGNVRELENAVLRAVVVGTSELIEVGDLPLQVARSIPAGPIGEALIKAQASSQASGNAVGAAAALADCERDAIAAALAESHGHRKQAAEILGIGVATLYRKLKRYEIE
jgi:DNA-binding NtrC family response regulator